MVSEDPRAPPWPSDGAQEVSRPAEAAANGGDKDALPDEGPLEGESKEQLRGRLDALLLRLSAALAAEAVEDAGAAEQGVNAPSGSSTEAPTTFGEVANAAADNVLPSPADSGCSATSSGHVGIPGDSDDEDEVDSGPAADVTDAELGASLAGLPWDIIVTRDAFAEWSSLERSFRRIVVLKLQDIGEGRWLTMGACGRRLGDDGPSNLNLWRCKFTKGGRIVFDIAPGWSPVRNAYVDLVRVWCITHDHKRYMAEMSKVIESVKKAAIAAATVSLVPLGAPVPSPLPPAGRSTPTAGRNATPPADRSTPSTAGPGPGDRPELLVPKSYAFQGEEEEGTQRSLGPGVEPVEVRPPLAFGNGTVPNLMKFYDLNQDLATTILSGMAQIATPPFRVSPEEGRIIQLPYSSPVVLAGRSGTGKTTVIIFRMFTAWLVAWRTQRNINQIFISMSGTLRLEVQRAFMQMRRGVVPCDVADELDAQTSTPVVSLAKTASCWSADADGIPGDAEGLALEIDFDSAVGSPSRERFSAEAKAGGADVTGGTVAAGDPLAAPASSAGQRLRHPREMGYTEFAAKWSLFAPANLRDGKRVSPALAWADIVSYIKGSAAAAHTAAGHLSLTQYRDLGLRRAPNFASPELRADVYRVFEGYQRYLWTNARYDAADAVASITRRLGIEGYKGVPIYNIYRDEVQDCTISELLLDLRIATDPNSLFYCGDTAQTISRGLSFRFDDVTSLFYEEAVAMLEAWGGAAASPHGAGASV